ncbi:MAG TPA: hypothetical protein VF160_05445 [Candidatus Dormibacteraeota bacterium]
MANFVLLYTGGRMPEGEAEQKQVMEAWMGWFGGLGDKVVDAGNPFAPEARRIESGGKTGDPNGNRPTGYSIIKADSLDEAVKLAKGCPVLLGGAAVEVYETSPVM